MSKWPMVRLGNVCDVRDGTHDSPKYVINGYPLITSKNLTNGYIDISDVNYITEEDYKKVNARSYVDNGDILMPMIGTIGNPIIVNKTFDFAIKNVALIKFNNKNVFNKYISFILSSGLFLHYIDQENRGGTQKFISLSNIRSFTFPLPPLDEQKRIAAVLDKAQSLIDLRKKQISDMDVLAQSVFLDMFGDPAKLPYYYLENLINEKRGLSYGIVQPGDNVNEGVYIIRPVDILNNQIVYDNLKCIDTEIEKAFKRTRLNGNEILITVRGTTGASALADFRCKEMNVTRGIAVMELKDIVNKIYLHEYLKSKTAQIFIQDNTKGATLRQINLSDLRKLPVPIPSMALQNSFSICLKQLNQQKQKMLQGLALLEQNYNALMQQYFS